MAKNSFILLAAMFALTGCTADQHPTAPEVQTTSFDSPVRTTSPSAADPGLPYYARVEPAPPFVYHDDEWAAIVFYRDPSCVPGGFDLIRFFDAPAAFGCSQLVTANSMWKEGAFMGAPKVVKVSGSGAVPVWFFPTEVVLPAAADGVLTMTELRSLPNRLTGSASRYDEVVHPHPLPPSAGGGGHANPKLIITARGSLEDGRSFRLHMSRGDYDEVHGLRIMIR